MNSKGADAAWRWLCRGLAVAGFVVVSIANFKAPGGAYILLIGLFFGPDVFDKLPGAK